MKRTGQTVLVTRFGEPVAEIVPPSLPETSGNWLGAMAGTGRIAGDIVVPVVLDDEWEVLT